MRNDSGFTLIEIMLVVIIIGILAGMVVPSFVGRSREARIKAAQGDIATLGTQLNLFELDKGKYPNSLSELVSGDRKYIDATGVPKDPWGNEYVYKPAGDGYTLKSCGPDGVEGTEDDVSPANR
jgi:general secretion pathway protein G